MNKKIKQNKFKAEIGENKTLDSGPSIDFCLNCIMTVAFISVLSLASIFAYDFVTQSNFFNIKEIEISGTKRVLKDDLIRLAKLTDSDNIFSINLFSIEKHITSHPWIQSATIKRTLPSKLIISVIEQEPLAIVKIENLADILINTQGRPFKEYDPQKDHIENLPVISGLDLTTINQEYLFNGPLFNSIMNFFKTDISSTIRVIKGDNHTGITIEANDIYNRLKSQDQPMVQIKLGFDNFDAKLNKAKKISEYIDKNFPTRTICAMDLFNIKKVFIKTRLTDALHNNLEKGV
ncbi:MAG: FtsQ-type POTRA domain-containing protein [Proteobacteria bacterium]|nr:FtsQ-type POTRA domain-containing protein [Pseudomonadota bacterium]MBU1585583.1 FtsQ-type POTRA domain-containing protein [Pseudomonadota bacterium]MBU2452005.1 FtsQ-type POTRA domain-containing protein [Pseudomonadota bacterium]MBU2628563.1 FtsQ-type POTRA domain-containing protein [Pseudomonadota bacterium]